MVSRRLRCGWEGLARTTRYHARMDSLDQHALRPGSHDRLRAIQRAFRKLSTPDWRYPYSLVRRLKRLRGFLVPAVLGVGAGFGALHVYDLSVRFDSFEFAMLHVLSATNCDAVRANGLAPARRGNPGYYAHHDADGDGLACEPWGGR